MAGHSSQSAAEVEPTETEYRPARQLLHAASPDAALNLPAAHAAQAPPLAPVAPALQAHAAPDTEPAGEAESAAHDWHALDVAPVVPEYVSCAQTLHPSDPIAVLYVPASHLAQTPPSAPE